MEHRRCVLLLGIAVGRPDPNLGPSIYAARITRLIYIGLMLTVATPIGFVISLLGARPDLAMYYLFVTPVGTDGSACSGK